MARSPLLAAVLCAAGALAACRQGSGPVQAGFDAGDVVLITVGGLRPEHMSLLGYERDTTPELHRWFGAGALYRRAYAAHAEPGPSAVSLLSGELPEEHRVRVDFQRIGETKLLPELLPLDYRSAAFVSTALLAHEATGLASRFDHYDDYVTERGSFRLHFERSAARTTDVALSWLDARGDSGRPLFLWLHYSDPNGPYDAPPGWNGRFQHAGARHVERERVPEHVRDFGVTDALDYVDRYDAELAFVDHHVGRFLDGFAERRPADRALIVLTATHGQSLLEHERWFSYGHDVYDELVRVPLLVRGPGVEPGRKEVPVSLVDVAPTVLAFAGLPAPASAPGGGPDRAAADLRRASTLAPDRRVFTEAPLLDGQVRAVVEGSRKAVIRLESARGTIVSARLFDLERDPDELSPRPLAREHELARCLLERFARDPDPCGRPTSMRRGRRLTAPKVPPYASEAELDRLRAAGYVR